MPSRFARWRYEFDEDGGYDCTSAAFKIVTGREGMSDWCPLRVDVRAFVSEAALAQASEEERHLMLHDREPFAEDLAALLVALLNAHGA